MYRYVMCKSNVYMIVTGYSLDPNEHTRGKIRHVIHLEPVRSLRGEGCSS